MTATVNAVWGPLRALLQQEFSYSDIKQIAGLAGLDLALVAKLEPRNQSSYVSKGQLMTAIDQVLGSLNRARRDRFLVITAEEMATRNNSLADQMDEYLSRLGWSFASGKLLPIELLDESQLDELPSAARVDMTKASGRLRDGDLSGAVAAACGAIDSVTADLYAANGLGDPYKASFQERVVRSIDACGLLGQTDADLASLGWSAADAKLLVHNLRGSINQAAYVMQTLRSQMGDVHGTKATLKPLVFDCLKWAALILRLLKSA